MSLISGIELVNSPHPMSIGDIPVQFLESGDSTVTTTGNGVSEWRDKSGNGSHATQSTDSARPIYSGTQNGKTVLTLNGSSHWLTVDSPPLAAGTDDYTVLSVLNPNFSGNDHSAWEQRDSANAANERAALLFIGSAYGFNGQGNDYHWAWTYTPSSWMVGGFRKIGTTEMRVYHNLDEDSGALGKISAGNPNLSTLNISADVCRIGQKDTSEWWSGNMAAHVIWDVALSDYQVRDMIRYLMNGWGIT